MSIERKNQLNRTKPPSPWRAIISIFATLVVLLLIFFGATFALTPSGQAAGKWLNWLFALDSVQLWWYVTRASGIVAYLLLWFSMVLGLAVTSKYLDRLLDRLFTYDFHQFISLLSIAFVGLHVAVLMLDRYLPYSIWQTLVPFISPYRPFWVGVGVIGFYITLLVTITFYIRSRIGMRAFRLIHVLSLVGYLGVTLHGVYAGTDSPLPAMQLLYKGTALVVIFLTIFWLVLLALRKLEARRLALAAARLPRRRHAIARD
ncbi:MAG: ferric reductase-like transmembrane domain-containing protein [Chloroflexi bacterium]|nr:ferric reductase-like transmembrane domain-containing protein [Chloroflexota bacterium]